MEAHFREHYSQNFYFDYKKTPLKLTDRTSVPVLLAGFIFGLLFTVLGYYLLNQINLTGSVDFDQKLTQTTIYAPKLIPTDIFALMMLIVGCGILLASLFFALRRKTISFDGTTLTVTDHPVLGKAHSFVENIHEYTGVRLRVKLSQFGIFNCNKFILELYHKDPQKIIPLYISRSVKNLRTLWKAYAVKFELMPIHITERGMVSHRISDLDADFQEVIKKWNLPKNFITENEHSDLLVFKRRQNTKMIKLKRFIFDAYSILNIITVLIIGTLLTYAIYNNAVLVANVPLFLLLFLYILALSLIFYAFLTLFIKDILFIYNKRLIIFKKVFGVSCRQIVIPFTLIKAVDITYTPTTGRYSLTIIAEDQTATVFSKLSVEDLRYIRGYLLYEIGELNALKEDN